MLTVSHLIKPTGALFLCALAVACGDSTPSDTAAVGTSSGSGGPGDGSDSSGTPPATGTSGSSTATGDGSTTTTAESGSDTESTGDETGSGPLGNVDFVVIYEAGSAWESNDTAREMVDTVFADFEATLRTSGPWDATVEVYLTDDNTGNANTSFDQTFSEAMVDEQTVLVVPAWQKVVRGADDPNGPAMADGTGSDFIIHFNVAGHEDNRGLLRHEMMHGMGAVNAISNLSVTDTGTLVGPTVGERQMVALYDLQLIDLVGMPLVANYDDADGTFEIQPYTVETTLDEWMDGNGGVFFRGVTPEGGTLEMPCGTFPLSDTEGLLVLNEPADLMSAGAHPTWNTLDEPDRAFLASMHYELAP